ncbi:hypothetical protein [uncultured Lamprocystis sp.]|jgi:hypothetical protein|uniref:hypothetical protein n=1 Tax=uncultured Lamprocystis sp. TaxID=543132 RepID=UPI0025D3C6F6|nr:hypothetical protein [uncultured Lamprocystis sp.]
MTKEVTALLAFCEGAHEVAFLQRLLKARFEFEKVVWRFSEFPSPFNSLFKRNVERHAAQDLSLDMAHKFYLPDKVLRRGDNLALLFNSGGKTAGKLAQVGGFLADFLDLHERASTFPNDAPLVVGRVRVLFLHDADGDGADRVRASVKQTFATIGERRRPWFTEDWTLDAANPNAATALDIASYVWADAQGVGTLEDHLMPVLRACDPQRCSKAECCVDELFSWGGGNRDPIAERARRHKAIITLLGQREKPGSSQNVIIDQASVLDPAALLAHEGVASFTRFLEAFLDMGQPV